MRYAIHNSGRSKALAGITLIEVMMSAMVVSLGIMGLVALIPLGTHLTKRGTQADRVASIGERGYHEAMIRGHLNPASWVSPTGGGLAAFIRPHATTPGGLPVRQPYLIDPWFFPDDSTEGGRRFFPASQNFAIGGGPNSLRMHRLSLLSAPNSGSRMPRRQTVVTYMSEDDLASERPSDGDLPPFQTFYTRDGSTASVPVRRQAQGDYTWMLMLVPDLRNIQPLAANAGLPVAQANQVTPPVNFAAGSGISNQARTVLNNNLTDEYNLSVIVMQQPEQPRVPPTGQFGDMLNGASPSERVLRVNPATFANTGGYSTGEVQLELNRGGATPQQVENMLRLANGDWICLAGRVQVNNYPAGDVYQWYRVSSVSEIIDPGSATPSIYVTFTGPDWSSVTASPNPPTHAIIVDGVVGVHTKRVRLDLSTY